MRLKLTAAVLGVVEYTRRLREASEAHDVRRVISRVGWRLEIYDPCASNVSERRDGVVIFAQASREHETAD